MQYFFRRGDVLYRPFMILPCRNSDLFRHTFSSVVYMVVGRYPLSAFSALLTVKLWNNYTARESWDFKLSQTFIQSLQSDLLNHRLTPNERAPVFSQKLSQARSTHWQAGLLPLIRYRYSSSSCPYNSASMTGGLTSLEYTKAIPRGVELTRAVDARGR